MFYDGDGDDDDDGQLGFGGLADGAFTPSPAPLDTGDGGDTMGFGDIDEETWTSEEDE